MSADPALAELLTVAAALGRDPAQVQGPGGNVSLKRDGLLWVKASGTWLAEAERRPILVPVRLDALREAIAAPGDAAERAEDFVDQAANAAGLRPSIETTFHAALPHPVVLHTHCVETIAWAARTDAEAVLAGRLGGLRWVFAPYIRPGLPLTRLMLARGAREADVVVLGNHGLVAGGATAAEAAARLAEVARRLRRPPRSAPPPDLPALERLAAGSAYAPAEEAHAVATDPKRLAVARRGSLYPDHVVFLGPGVACLAPGEGAAGRSEPLLIAPGHGALRRRDAAAAVPALARCLADVTGRLAPEEPILALTEAEEAALLGWDAEKLRQAAAR
jgi:rhamnose utilization protein RhaD (predicted bifunctional aldolase and dehydrogenase)